MPLPEPPPYSVVPYSVLPDKINPAGHSPSLLVELLSAVKLCNVVKVCAVTRPNNIQARAAISTGRRNRLFVFISEFLLIAVSNFFGGARVLASRLVNSLAKQGAGGTGSIAFVGRFGTSGP